MKINKIRLSYIFIILIIGIINLSSIQLVLGQTTTTTSEITDPTRLLTSDNRILNLNEVGFKIGGNIYNTETSYALPATNSYLKYEIATPAFAQDSKGNIIYTDFPPINAGFDINGKPIITFHRQGSLEFDVNVWTSIPTIAIAPNYQLKTDTITTSRLYIGDTLNIDQTKREDAADIKEVVDYTKTIGNPWAYGRHLYQFRSGDGQYGTDRADGDNMYKTQYYTETTATIPYFSFPTLENYDFQTIQGGSSSSPTIDKYTEQQQYIKDWILQKIDVGNFDILIDCTIDPLTSMPQVINMTNGNLSSPNEYVRFGGMSIIDSSKIKGLCNRNAASAISTFESTGIDSNLDTGDDQDGSVSTGTPTSNPSNYNYNNKDMDTTADSLFTNTLNSGTLFTYTPQPDKEFGIIGTNKIEQPNDIRAYSYYKNMYYSDLIKLSTTDGSTEKIDTLNNIYDWRLEIKNIQLTPQVTVWKNIINLHYWEYWLNINTGADTAHAGRGPLTNDALLYLLGGWEVYNVFVHFRVKVLVDYFTDYTMNFIQGGFGYNESLLQNVTDINTKQIMDLSPMGTYNIKSTSSDFNLGNWLDDLFGSLSDWFANNSWIWLVLIGIAVFIIYTIIPKPPKQPKITQPQYIPQQPQYFPQQPLFTQPKDIQFKNG